MQSTNCRTRFEHALIYQDAPLTQTRSSSSLHDVSFGISCPRDLEFISRLVPAHVITFSQPPRSQEPVIRRFISQELSAYLHYSCRLPAPQGKLTYAKHEVLPECQSSGETLAVLSLGEALPQIMLKIAPVEDRFHYFCLFFYATENAAVVTTVEVYCATEPPSP